MIGQEVSHYRILGRLGGGGMGVVYRAEDTRLGRIVALKFLNAELLSNESTRRRFLHEARAASLIDHPNVCHVYEVGEADSRTFMAMSYCEGRSLREVIDSGPVPAREAFSIAFGVAQGLWAAHRRGIVHRDIKPGNVILTDDGFVRIVDFGLALLVGHSRVTTSGVTVGTVAYMSPEQTTGSDVGANTDIWSLGVTLYEMLMGRLPFRGEIHAAMVYSLVHEPHTPLPESVPPECARIVDRCLEKDPAKRYQTIEELLEDMVRVARALGWDASIASATIAPILQERRRRTWTRRIAIGAAAAVVIAGGAYGAYRWTHRAPALFTTKIRVAVLPFRNHIGPAHDAMVTGLGDHITRLLDAAPPEQASMWVVPFSRVVRAQLPDAAAAASSFGVNRIIMGDVQRYGSTSRLTLELCDAGTLDVVRKEAVDFDPAAPVSLLSGVTFAVNRLLRLRDGPWSAPLQSREGAAIRPYLSGLGLLVPPTDPAARQDMTRGDLAAAELDSCAHIDPEFHGGTRAAGEAALHRFERTHDTGALERARALARRVAAPPTAYADGAALLGDVERVTGDPDSAIAAYRQALRIDAGHYLATYWLANLLATHSRVSEAESTYIDLTRVKPDFWAVFVQMGAFYFGQNRLTEAEAAWERARALAPRDALTLSNLGVIRYRRDEWTAAREMFLEAFRIKPECESCNNIATTLYLDGKYDESARYFDFAVQYCDTNDCSTWGNLASALYWVDGKRDQARAVYRHAIQKALAGLAAQPGDAALTSFLIDYYSMSDDTLNTRAAIAGAGRLLEENDRVMYSVGSAYEKLGQRELALHHLGNAVRHGFPRSVIEVVPLLRDLVKDSRFQEVIGNDAAERVQAAQEDSH